MSIKTINFFQNTCKKHKSITKPDARCKNILSTDNSPMLLIEVYTGKQPLSNQ